MLVAATTPPTLRLPATRLHSGPGAARRPGWFGLVLVLLCLVTVPLRSVETGGNVVIVRTSDAAPYAAAAEAIRRSLAEPDRTITVVDLNDLTADDSAAYKAILAAGKATMFVAVGSQGAEWLHGRLPAEIMLIYCMVADPEVRGLLRGRASFGISTTITWAEQRQLILQALPQTQKIGMLYAKNDPASKAAMEDLKSHLGSGLELVAIAIEDSETVSDAIQSLMNNKPDVVWTSPDNAVYSSAAVRGLLLLALRHKIPVFGFSTSFVRAGALFGVGIEPERQGKQCGELCARYLAALKAGKTDDFLKLTRIIAPLFHLAINQIVAKQLDRSLPDEFTARADVIYKPE